MGGLLGWPVGGRSSPSPACLRCSRSLMLRRAWRLEAVVAIAAAATMRRRPRARAVARPKPAVVAGRRSPTRGARASIAPCRCIATSACPPSNSRSSTPRATRSRADRPAFLPAMLVVGDDRALWLANLASVAPLGRGGRSCMTLSRWRTPDWVDLAPDRVRASRCSCPPDLVGCGRGQRLRVGARVLLRAGPGDRQLLSSSASGCRAALRVATYLVIALQHVAAALVVALGVFDLWGDFRQLTARPADAAVGSRLGLT